MAKRKNVKKQPTSDRGLTNISIPNATHAKIVTMADAITEREGRKCDRYYVVKLAVDHYENLMKKRGEL